VPEPIRGNVLSLAAFVDRQTLQMLADPSADKLTALISINRELAGGLFVLSAEPTVPAEEDAVLAAGPGRTPAEPGQQAMRISA
jgi:hypothetical protein